MTVDTKSTESNAGALYIPGIGESDSQVYSVRRWREHDSSGLPAQTTKLLRVDKGAVAALDL
jgi:hypothetical protein